MTLRVRGTDIVVTNSCIWIGDVSPWVGTALLRSPLLVIWLLLPPIVWQRETTSMRMSSCWSITQLWEMVLAGASPP